MFKTSILGNGAWKGWQYELNVASKCKFNPHCRPLKLFQRPINGSEYTMTSLSSGTQYAIRVRAFSSGSTGGEGPLSAEFVGSTLNSTPDSDPYLIWSTEDGLQSSDLLGENITPIIHATKLSVSQNQCCKNN